MKATKVQIDSTCGTATASVTINSLIEDWRGEILAFKGTITVQNIRGQQNTYKGVFRVSVDSLEVFYFPDAAYSFLLIEALIKAGIL